MDTRETNLVTTTQSLFYQGAVKNQTKICFSILNENDIADAAKCVTKTFVENNPVTNKLEITNDEHDVYSNHICKIAAKTGLSVVAREKDSQKFIGCMIVQPANYIDELPEASEKFGPIIAILEKTSEKLPIKENDEALVHLLTLTVHNEYQGQKIAQKILAVQLDYLSQTAYQNYCIEFTNPYCYKALRNVVADEVQYENTTKYQDFTYNDKKPFAGIDGEMISCMSPIRSLKFEWKEWVEEGQRIEYRENKSLRNQL